MNTYKTLIWLDGHKEQLVTVDYSVTDLDEAARLLNYADYQDLLKTNPANDENDSPLNFKHME